MTDSWFALLRKGPPYRQAENPIVCPFRELPVGPRGRKLCRCGCGKEAVPPRRVFVNGEHELAFRLAIRWSVIRRAVWYRDKGVCAHCGIDTNLERQRWRALRKEHGRNADRIFLRAGFDIRDQWQAHHVVPRSQGGTNALTNIITLCVPCHKAAHGQNGGNGNGY